MVAENTLAVETGNGQTAPISARRHEGSFARMAAMPIVLPVSRSNCHRRWGSGEMSQREGISQSRVFKSSLAGSTHHLP